jgi:hypothetical protein
MAPGIEEAEKSFDVFIENYGAKYAYSHENDRQIPFKVTNNYSFKAAVFSI